MPKMAGMQCNTAREVKNLCKFRTVSVGDFKMSLSHMIHVMHIYEWMSHELNSISWTSQRAMRAMTLTSDTLSQIRSEGMDCERTAGICVWWMNLPVVSSNLILCLLLEWNFNLTMEYDETTAENSWKYVADVYVPNLKYWGPLYIFKTLAGSFC